MQRVAVVEVDHRVGQPVDMPRVPRERLTGLKAVARDEPNAHFMTVLGAKRFDRVDHRARALVELPTLGAFDDFDFVARDNHVRNIADIKSFVNCQERCDPCVF